MNYVYYISLGSNLGDRQAYLDQAVKGLKQQVGVISVVVSTYLETPPWGNTDQDFFLNGIAKVVTTLTPMAMLQCMQRLEKQAGRKRIIHWGPRTLDLDIVWAETEGGKPLVITTERLTIPHPYLWERSFVLIPLKELYPDFRFHGQAIGERIDELECQSFGRNS